MANAFEFDVAEFFAGAKEELARQGIDPDAEEEDSAESAADTAEETGKTNEAETAEPEEGKADEDKNAGAVTPAERVSFRAEKRRWKERFTAEKQAFEQEKVRHQQSLERFVSAQKLYEEGDVEGAIEKLTGDSFATVAQNVIKKAQGRDLKAEREIAKIKLEREAEKREAEKLRLEAEKQAQADRNRAWAHENIVKPLESKEDTKPLLQIPGFVDMVFGIQLQAYSQDEEEISLEEATNQARERYQKIYESLHAALGDRSTKENESDDATGQPGKAAANRGRRGRHIPKSRATSASRANVPHFTDPSDPSYFDWLQKHMSSHAED
jgi:hypothetical protein